MRNKHIEGNTLWIGGKIDNYLEKKISIKKSKFIVYFLVYFSVIIVFLIFYGLELQI